MSESSTPSGRLDRRLIAALLAAIVITVVVVAAIAGVPGGSAQPTAPTGATQPPVAIADQVVADGRAVPVRAVEMSVTTPATVATVPVELGESVDAGTVLVTFETDDIDARIAEATAAVEAATARASQAEALVTQAEEQVSVSEADLDRAQAALETARDRNVGEDAAVATRSAARAQVRVAKAAVAGALEGATAAAADVRRAAAGVQTLELARADLTVTAPFAGVVASLDASAGASVSPGEIVVRVADPRAWEFVTTDLDESGIARVAVGDKATVTLDGVPGEGIAGTVARVGTFGASRQGGIVYEVVVTPDGEVPDGVRWNMTATIAIETGP